MSRREESGGQVKTGWRGSIRRPELPPKLCVKVTQVFGSCTVSVCQSIIISGCRISMNDGREPHQTWTTAHFKIGRESGYRLQIRHDSIIHISISEIKEK